MDHHNHTVDYLVIGGGVAGLSALNRLADLKKNPVLIEASDYPSHKVCGEFLSPEALPYLKKWNIIPDCSISDARFFLGSYELAFKLPTVSYGISRYKLDTELAERAKKNGATIISNTRVLDLCLFQSSPEIIYAAKLSTGNVIYARNVFVGGGRFFNSETNLKKPKMPYFGFKAHFSGIDIQNTLEMHVMPAAYLGISHVANDTVNVACLVKVKDKIHDHASFIEKMLASAPFELVKKRLDGGKMIFDNWLSTHAPDFGVRTNTHLENVYFIGDAAGTIAPATGNGLGMAITSGFMAADFAVNDDHASFDRAWKRRYAARIKRGHLLHHAMMCPSLAKCAFFVCKNAPSTLKMIFSSTRES